MILGYHEVYHGFSVMANIRDCDMWCDAIEAKYEPTLDRKPFGRTEFDQILGHCEAICDMPANIFAEELIEAYPEAKVCSEHSSARTLSSSLMNGNESSRSS
jgi:hypothetical protein